MNDLEKAIKDADGDVLHALDTALKQLKKKQHNTPCCDFGRCNCPTEKDCEKR